MHSWLGGAWPGTKLALTEAMACPSLLAQEGGVERESEANFSPDDTSWLPALSKHPRPSMRFKAAPTPQPLTSKEPVYSFLLARAFLACLPACACHPAPSEWGSPTPGQDHLTCRHLGDSPRPGTVGGRGREKGG